MARSNMQGNKRPQGRTPQGDAPKRRKPAGFYDEDDMVDYDYERSARFANRGCLIVFAAIMLALVGLTLGIFIYVTNEIDGGHSSAKGTVTVDIPSGSGGQTVATILSDSGLIGNASIFRFWVRFNGAGSGFQRGTFDLEPGMSYVEMVEILSQEPVGREEVQVTFPEGSTIQQFGTRLVEAGLPFTVEEFVEEANNGDFSDIPFFENLTHDPNVYMKAEGYLAPDTYRFFNDDTAHNVLEKLFTQFNTNITTNRNVSPDIYARLQEQGITLREAVTLASIVEEECSDPVEQADVAGVFWNRMKKDLPADMARRTLGSDATQRYLQDWVSRGYGSGPEDFVDQTLEWGKEKLLSIMPAEAFYAYFTGDGDPNTREGLTAGPISCPGTSALNAALYPTNHNYFYFVSDDEGTYYFAETYNGHLANIQTANGVNAKVAAEGGE